MKKVALLIVIFTFFLFSFQEDKPAYKIFDSDTTCVDIDISKNLLKQEFYFLFDSEIKNSSYVKIIW